MKSVCQSKVYVCRDMAVYKSCGKFIKFKDWSVLVSNSVAMPRTSYLDIFHFITGAKHMLKELLPPLLHLDCSIANGSCFLLPQKNKEHKMTMGKVEIMKHVVTN